MRHAVAAMLAVVASGLLFAAPAAAEDPVEILAFADYDRTLAPGEETTFTWSVRNADVIPYNISVAVEAPPGFTATVSVAMILDLQPNRASSITVVVRAPDSVASATAGQVVLILTVLDGGAVVFISTSTALVTIPSIFAQKRVLDVFANPLPGPLDNEWGVFLLDVAAWLAIAGALGVLLDPFVKRLTQRTKTQLDDIALRILKTPLAVLLFLYGALQSLNALDRHIPPYVIDGLGVIYGLGSALIFFYVGYRLFKDIGIHLARNVASRTQANMDDVIVPIFEKLGLLVLGLAALGLLLGFFEVDLTLFVAGGVVTSMVIAFAAQDTLSNFFAGMFLLTDRPFKEGDEVFLGDEMLVVRRIGMRTTRFFRYSDASMVTVPNNKLANEQIANFSNRKDPGLFKMNVGVGYGSDPDQVKDVIRGVLMRAPHVLKDDPDRAPIVRFKAMSDSSLDFFVLVWVDERPNRFVVEDFLNSEIYKALNAAGIDIPFPQRTVHLLLEGLERNAARGALPKDVAVLAEKLRKAMPAGPAVRGGEPKGVGPTASPGMVGGATSAAESEAPRGPATVTGEETVGDAFERVVGPAATVGMEADLHAAVQALLLNPSSRKVYVVEEGTRLVGVITIESLMKHLSHRLGAREAGIVSFMRFVRDMQTDSVNSFLAEPVKVTRETRILDIARLVVEHHLNDFPVVDAEGRLEGEVNSLRLLQAALSLFESRPGEGAGK